VKLFISLTTKQTVMKKLTITLITAFTISSFLNDAAAQGCVAIRTTGGYCSGNDHFEGKYQLSLNTRYLKSFRHFVGTEEQKQRLEQNTEVINHSYTTDIALSRKINARWSLLVDLPIISNTRSSLYEHSNVGRYTTRSFGIGDMRLAVYRWMWNPEKMPKGNLQIGAGIKLPTGDYKVQDYFQLTDSTRRLGFVDQSIQLGDGGTGFTLELNTFYNFSPFLAVYGNFYYLANPREHNGVSTTRGGTPSATALLNRSDVMSVPDQYMFRAGLSYTLQSFTLSAGLREECLPAKDLIGGNDGFRRPGRILDFEPGISYSAKRVNVFAYVPIALKRDRIQSNADILATKRTGVYTKGDAAFADYSINIGAAFKL